MPSKTLIPQTSRGSCAVLRPGIGRRGNAWSSSTPGSSGPSPAEFKLAESDAADVAQTTWLRLLEHIDRIEYPDRVGSWLAATARNECLRSLAARKRVVLAQR